MLMKGRRDAGVLGGGLKCELHFLRLIVQKKSTVLQISLQNGAIVQQH